MGDDNIKFYSGADYGLDQGHGEDFNRLNAGYRVPAGNFAFPTDPRTANQLKAVSDKLNTGAKVVEVSGVTPAELEAIPKQHFKEINRLKQLTGVDLTFHGPLVEASGFGDGGWSEVSRQGAERQMFGAIEKAHTMDPNGNIVVTFHTTSSVPEMEQTVLENGKPVTKQIIAINEYTGAAKRVNLQKNPFLKTEYTPQEQLDQENKDQWERELSQLSFHSHTGGNVIRDRVDVAKARVKDRFNVDLTDEQVLEIYKDAKNGAEWSENLKQLEQYGSKELSQAINKSIGDFSYGEVYVRDAYNDLQKKFNDAYEALKKSNNDKAKKDLVALEKYQETFLKQKTNLDASGGLENPDNLIKFSEMVQDGVNILTGITPPKTFRPMNDFIIDKSSETFSNLALNSFSRFKENAPIISVENPPAGGGLARGKEIRQLVEASQEKFVEKAMKSQKDGGLGLSKEKAEKEAKKLIGVTWDVGHINMLRKYGYTDKELPKETEQVAEYIKHIHLSDNFGFEHTELPMGMGDVPLNKHFEAIGKYNKQMDKLKQVVETGGPWFRDFKVTPINETLRAFGSPVYGMQMSPYWNQSSGASGGYFAGYGRILPEKHFELYGAGFSNLPPELGGQLSGTNRLSGSPVE